MVQLWSGCVKTLVAQDPCLAAVHVWVPHYSIVTLSSEANPTIFAGRKEVGRSISKLQRGDFVGPGFVWAWNAIMCPVLHVLLKWTFHFIFLDFSDGCYGCVSVFEVLIGRYHFALPIAPIFQAGRLTEEIRRRAWEVHEVKGLGNMGGQWRSSSVVIITIPFISYPSMNIVVFAL